MKLIQTTLTGIGQIFLQENYFSGLLITIGMFFSHWALGVACLLGSLIGTLTAQGLKFPEEQIQQGLYGFNASLAMMCALFTFGEDDPSRLTVWLLGAVAAVVATLIMRVFMKAGRPAYTFPFVLTSWAFCWGVAHFGLFGLAQTTPPLADYTDPINAAIEPLYAWAEVNFGSSLLTGLFLFTGIAISSPHAAMWGTAAATFGTALAAWLFNIDGNSLANGLYGFSAVLVACAFVGNRLLDLIYVVLGIALAVIIQYAVAQTGLSAYTFGFIAASWLVLFAKKYLERTALASPRA
ncbi:urea transporter [Neisseria perflava]|uniref:urea transporter n=1 Tax=Neisseria perflava TaxID=33053 RepID=UPI00209D80AF|nr:urea transporter [Neisseria perflava]MCP1772318.1 urea transporter [Neisseria perflava]